MKLIKNIKSFFCKSYQENGVPYENKSQELSLHNNYRKIYTIDYKNNKIVITFLHISSGANKDSIEKNGLLPYSPQELKNKILEYLYSKYGNFDGEDFFNQIQNNDILDENYLYLKPRISNNPNMHNLQNCIYANYFPYSNNIKIRKLGQSEIYANGGEAIQCAENIYLKRNNADLTTKEKISYPIFCLIRKELFFEKNEFKYLDSSFDGVVYKYDLYTFEEFFKSSNEIRFKKVINSQEMEIISKDDFNNLICGLISEEAQNYLNMLRTNISKP